MNADAPAPRSAWAAWKRPLGVLLAAALVPLAPFLAIGELPGERWLSDAGGDALSFGAVGAALLASDVLIPIPSSILGAMLGGRLGFVAGFGWTWLGLSLGLCIGYALGRLLPARWASALPAAPSFALVFLSRPVPVLAEAVALTAGIERLPPARVALAGTLGNALYAAALAGDGAAWLPEGLAGPGLILPMLLPVLAYGLWYKFGRHRTGRA